MCKSTENKVLEFINKNIFLQEIHSIYLKYGPNRKMGIRIWQHVAASYLLEGDR